MAWEAPAKFCLLFQEKGVNRMYDLERPTAPPSGNIHQPKLRRPDKAMDSLSIVAWTSALLFVELSWDCFPFFTKRPSKGLPGDQALAGFGLACCSPSTPYFACICLNSSSLSFVPACRCNEAYSLLQDFGHALPAETKGYGVTRLMDSKLYQICGQEVKLDNIWARHGMLFLNW